MGYIGKKQASEVIYTGLKKLEYRGYDSAGIATLDTQLQTHKTLGDTSGLKSHLQTMSGSIGIGHTRWATHGKPSVQNAHPHTYGAITLVHNGIIENYEELRDTIPDATLQSETDSEVLAAFINIKFQQTGTILEAIKQALVDVRGTFGLAIISPEDPDHIIVARRGSPIIIGIHKDEKYIASDSAAILDYTDKVIYLEDNQIAKITRKSIDIFDLDLKQQAVHLETVEASNQSQTIGSFSSYLEKEIFEQPQALRNTMRGRVKRDTITLGGPNLSVAELKRIKSIVIIGCGTAYYAGLYAKYELEKILEIPVCVEHASEFRYRHSALNPQTTLAVFMSQSGETADTLASLHEAKRRGFKTIGIINTVGSTIAREVKNGGIYLHAGTESSVASTKAYTSMVTALLMLGGYMSHSQGRNNTITADIAQELQALPKEIEFILAQKNHIEKLAKQLSYTYTEWFILGREQLFPVALEGALKLSEVAYIHAQAFPAGEMKHGPIALIDNKHLSILLMPENKTLYEKSVSTLEEIKAREGNVLTISTRPKEALSDFHIEIAHAGNYIDGLLYVVCLQLLTLYIATHKKLNVDRPRNLAKSVTVE